MAIIEEERGLEWSHVYIFDDGATEDLTTDWDPEAQVVFASESTIVVRGTPEAEGDVVVRIVVDEPVDLREEPVLLAAGRVSAPGGRLVARTSSWDEPLRLAVPPGDYDFSVHADHDTWPRRIALQLRRRSMHG